MQHDFLSWMPMLKAYAESYVIEEDRDYFLARLESHVKGQKMARFV